MTAAGTINQLAITVTAASDTKTYDGTTTSAGVPTITAGSLATGDTTTNFHPGLRQPECRARVAGTQRDRQRRQRRRQLHLHFRDCRRDHQPARHHGRRLRATPRLTMAQRSPRPCRPSPPAAWRPATPQRLSPRSSAAGTREPMRCWPGGIVNDGNGGDNYSYTFVTCRRHDQPARHHRHRSERYQDLRRNDDFRGTCQSSLQVWEPVMRANFTQVFDSRDAGPRTLTASRTWSTTATAATTTPTPS